MPPSGTPYFANGEWTSAWNKRKFSDEFIEQAKDQGATILFSEFYKGFGHKLESQDWPRLTSFVERCHARGLKVRGYVQARSLYSETLLDEQPDMEDWIARNHDESKQIWGSAYYRFAPCLTSAPYLEYLSLVVRDGLAKIGLDGIHLDNNYYFHCWCKRCQRKFREFLEARDDIEALTGLPFVSHVKAPPLNQAALGQDPLQILWIEFGVQVRREFFSRLRSVVKDASPAAVFSGNPAFPKRLASRIALALDPRVEGSIFDEVCAEGGSLPRIEGGSCISQAEAYLMGEAGGYRVWNTSWKKVGVVAQHPQRPGEIWSNLAEEFSYQAIRGNNWALRPSGNDDECLFEARSELTAAFRKASGFFAKLHSLPELKGRHIWTEVGILVDPVSLSLANPIEIPLFHLLLQYLFFEKIPFRFILTDRSIPETVSTLVVFHQGNLADSTLEKVASYAQRPACKAWIGGHSGQQNEFMQPRNQTTLDLWKQSPGFVTTNGFGQTWAESYASLPKPQKRADSHMDLDTFSIQAEHREPFDEFFKGPHFQPLLRFELSEVIMVHTETTEAGGIVIHLRNQAGTAAAVTPAVIRVSARLGPVLEVRLHCPDFPLDEAIMETTGTEAIISLPPFSYYCAIILTCEHAASSRLVGKLH